MAGYNLPDNWSWRAFDEHFGDNEPRCEKCKQEPCECCKTCGAAPEQACEQWCGVGDVLPDNPSPELIDYWQDRSELFEPPRSDYHGD